MSDSVLNRLAQYSQEILGYEKVAVNKKQLVVQVPEGALNAGRAAGSEVCISDRDVATCSGQFSWLAEQIKERCPLVYKFRLTKKNCACLPAVWAIEPPAQLLLIWWSVSIRAVNLQEQLLLLPYKVENGAAAILPAIPQEEEEMVLANLTAGAVTPAFDQQVIEQVQALSRDYFTKKLAPEVTAAMQEVEERRQTQLQQIDTYYFLTSKRVQERVATDEAAQRWQLETLAQDKARLVGQLGQRYSAESVIINISPEVVVLCGYGK